MTATTAARPRLRVLVSAYHCAPTGGPEAGAGWAFVTAAARTHDVWVVCRDRFVPSIEEALRTDPALAAHLHVVPLDPPAWVVRSLRRSWDVYWFYLLWQLLLARTARRLHAEVGFDVAHHVTFANDWMPCGLTALHDVPLVWGPVGGASRVPFWRLRRWLGLHGVLTEVTRETVLRLPRRLWGDRTARRAAVVVAQNHDVGRRFERQGAVVVEPNAALDLAELPRRRPPEPGEAPRALVVARLIPWKGAALALRALATPALAAWRLDIYGDGPLRARLETEADALGIADRVRFHGHRPRTEVLEAMAAATVLLFPSMHDQAGWAVAEASSIGVPVVCLPLGGPPILAGRNLFEASLHGDLVVSIARQVERAARTGGRPHDRWSRERLPGLVDDWYRRAGSSRRPPAPPSTAAIAGGRPGAAS